MTDQFELFKANNTKLKPYEQVWNIFEELIVLKPRNFEFSFNWRADAEAKMGGGMSSEGVRQFVQYFFNCLPPDRYFRNILSNRDKYKNKIILEITYEHELEKII